MFLEHWVSRLQLIFNIISSLFKLQVAAVSVEMNAAKFSLESIMAILFAKFFEEVNRSKCVVSAFEIMRYFLVTEKIQFYWVIMILKLFQRNSL